MLMRKSVIFFGDFMFNAKLFNPVAHGWCPSLDHEQTRRAVKYVRWRTVFRLSSCTDSTQQTSPNLY